MTNAVSHGAPSRRPLSHNGRTVPNVYVRRDAQGRPRFEFQQKRNGRTSRVTLNAVTATDAVREADRLRVVSVEQGIGNGTLRLSSLAGRFVAESRSGEYLPLRGRLATSTLALYEQRLDSHVLPALGHGTRVRDVKAEHLRKLVDRLRLAGLSGSTIRGTVVATSAMFRYAVHRGHVPANPVLSLDGDLPSAGRRTEPVYLDRPEADQLLDGLSDEFRPVAACALFLGLRISEVLGLQWSDLDLTGGKATIKRQLGRDGRSLASLKTRSSEATLSIPAPLLTELRVHRDRQARRGFERVGSDRLVFVTRSGERSPGRRNALRAIQNVADQLGLRNAEGELLGAHDLRHSTAGLLRAAGWSDEDIAMVMRHSNARTTSALYGGRSEQATSEVRERAAEALA